MAGESAREIARRQREKAARLERSAARWEQGAAGEEAVANQLAALPPEWTVIQDVRWPGRRFANIDHVAVGPGGVFVIDAKNWSGAVEVTGGVLRQNGRHREPAVASGADAALAVAELTSLDPRIVHPVLCFARDEWVSGWARDVMVCSTFNLVAMLGSRPVVLTDEALTSAQARVAEKLRPATGRARSSAGSRRQTPVHRPVPKSRPRLSQGRAKSTGMRGVAGMIVVGLVAIIGLPVLAPVVADVVTGFVTKGLVPRTAEIGSAVTVPADSTRPTLRVTTVAVRPEKRKRPEAVQPVAVRLRFENVDSLRYQSGPELRISLLDQNGTRYQPATSQKGLGRAIKEGLRIGAGGSREGSVHFLLPAGAHTDEVELVVGSAPDETVRWTVK